VADRTAVTRVTAMAADRMAVHLMVAAPVHMAAHLMVQLRYRRLALPSSVTCV